MMIFSYVVKRDYGFAPNPFYDVCTLATCKPDIRHAANIGDWILGFASAKTAIHGNLIFAMKVEEKCSFDEYWNNPEFVRKKPVMNGSLKQNYGDNIYHHDCDGNWVQENSHHKNKDGTTNIKNLTKDTKRDAVLISRMFWYWGKEARPLESSLQELQYLGRGFSKNRKSDIGIMAERLSNWLLSMSERGYIGKPIKFEGGFEHYDGKS